MEAVRQHEINNREWVSFIGPWNPAYIITCALVSVVPFLIGFALGLSVASDVVFGVYVIIGGFFGDMLFTRVFGKTMRPFKGLNIRFRYLWLIIGPLVMILKPFE